MMPMMNNSLTAIQIGGLASTALVEGCEGRVMGITSRGVFLNTDQRILFVTDADYRSPYNIQLPMIPRQFEQFTTGDGWTYSQGFLTFLEKAISIDTANAAIWQPEKAPGIETTLNDQAQSMYALLQRMLALDPGKGWLFLADASDLAPGSEASIIHEITNRFLLNVEKLDMEGALRAGRSILGRGGGLTPSGDDWLSGFLLYHARTNNTNSFIRELGHSLTGIAFESTTKISANRIEAACLGWSEELFLEVVDSLLVSNAEISNLKIERLVSFGHSSGVDTCVGIGAALKTV
jgi:hypothetical protein